MYNCVYCRWTVVGVVSYGNGCADPAYAGVYARVTHYLDWILLNVSVKPVHCCYVHVCFVQVTTCGPPDSLTPLCARTFLLLYHLL